MTSATYPNHATFITGAMPADHGLVANFVLHKSEIHPAHRGRAAGADPVRRLCRWGFAGPCSWREISAWLG